MRPDTDQLKAQRSDIVASRILDTDIHTTRTQFSTPIKRKEHHTAIQLESLLLESLTGIIEIGKRDMSNPKYDGYFQSAVDALFLITGIRYHRP